MKFTYLRLVAYCTFTIICFCVIYMLPPFVKTLEVNSSTEVLSIVLNRINYNSNRLKNTKTNRLSIENNLKSKDKGTDYRFRNKNKTDFDIDFKKSTKFWLENSGLMKTKRRQREKYTDKVQHASTSNMGVNWANNINLTIHQYGFYVDAKLKKCNQKYHAKDRYAKSSNLTSAYAIGFGDGDASASEDVKLRKENIIEKLSDLRNTNPKSVGLGTNVSAANSIHVQNHVLERVKTKTIKKEIRDNINRIKLKKVLSKQVPLDTWVQHNLQNITRRKIPRKIRFATWPDYTEVNTLTNNFSDFTAISDTSLADGLTTRVRVLCWIMISTPQKLDQSFHITAIMDTWGKRCTKVLIMTSNHSFSPSVPVPIVRLNITGVNSAWSSTMEAIRYLYQYHLTDADWFLGTDDSTYVIMENLRYMLSEYNTKDPLYFDCHYKSPSARGLVTDITSYVLSQEAVKRIDSSSPFKCKRSNNGPNTVKLGQCHQNFLVDVINTRDSLGRGRFFTSSLEDAIFSQEKKKRVARKKKRIDKKKKKGNGCCSDYAISFRQKDPKDLYVMEYLVYHLRPYGVRFVAANNTDGPVNRTLNQPKQTEDFASILGVEFNEERDRIYADRSVADEMERRVRVLCLVLTFPDNHQRKAMHVKATWGKRCNILLFMSTESDSTLPTIALPVREGYHRLWGKTKEAFRYVYKHHREDAEWFMKADDDSYVVLENLRYMLSKYNSTDPMYFGLRYKSFRKGFMVGGPGYVLSRAALDKFVTESLPHSHLCRPDDATYREDYEMGKCLSNIGVKVMDSRDSMLRGRFFHSILSDYYFPEPELRINMFYWMFEGLKCCSKYAISFHRISPTQLHVMEYIIYHLKPYSYLWNGTESEECLSKKMEKYIKRKIFKSNQTIQIF